MCGSKAKKLMDSDAIEIFDGSSNFLWFSMSRKISLGISKSLNSSYLMNIKFCVDCADYFGNWIFLTSKMMQVRWKN